MIAISGTPVRQGFGDQRVTQSSARLQFGFDPSRPLLLVFGGSLGARAINEALAANADALIAKGYSILWQVGKGNNVEELKAKFLANPSIRVEEYIFEMEQAYAAADLVICRAGASSLAELARLGKPAILVPYPHAAENHQEANARAFEQSGAAVVLHDNELSAKLAEQIAMIDSDAVKERMSVAMKSRENKEAAKIVTGWLIARCSA
jgi:UDP-N-acetylglucosamine--N-acetylmuramyl-(pentapeptide) pyrophosphoryl-undecaprenol N-acetylglucosamine transferase